MQTFLIIVEKVVVKNFISFDHHKAKFAISEFLYAQLILCHSLWHYYQEAI
jgi:hypothetical protein